MSIRAKIRRWRMGAGLHDRDVCRWAQDTDEDET